MCGQCQRGHCKEVTHRVTIVLWLKFPKKMGYHTFHRKPLKTRHLNVKLHPYFGEEKNGNRQIFYKNMSEYLLSFYY